MSKEWVIRRTDLSKSTFGKLHNPKKVKELDDQLEEVCSHANNHDLVQKLCRKLIEEVVNIMQHNLTWNELAVQSKFNVSANNFRFRIQYDGGQYFDPALKKLDNVVGPSVEKFSEYTREQVEVSADGIVTIRLQIKI